MLSKLQQIAADKREARENGDAGFTLIELLVVVVIIGILIAIAIPLYLNYQKGAHDKSASSDLRAAVSALQQCYSENSNVYPHAATDTVVHTTSFSFTCGSTTEKINLSDGTSIDYTSADGTSFGLAAWNTGGHTVSTVADANNTGKYQEYDYSSTSGGTIGG